MESSSWLHGLYFANKRGYNAKLCLQICLWKIAISKWTIHGRFVGVKPRLLLAVDLSSRGLRDGCFESELMYATPPLLNNWASHFISLTLRTGTGFELTIFWVLVEYCVHYTMEAGFQQQKSVTEFSFTYFQNVWSISCGRSGFAPVGWTVLCELISCLLGILYIYSKASCRDLWTPQSWQMCGLWRWPWFFSIILSRKNCCLCAPWLKF